MRDKAIAVISTFGLLLGAGSLYWGETAVCSGYCVPQQLWNVDVPIAIVIASIIGLVYSLRPAKTAGSETPETSTS